MTGLDSSQFLSDHFLRLSVIAVQIIGAIGGDFRLPIVVVIHPFNDPLSTAVVTSRERPISKSVREGFVTFAFVFD